MSKVEIKNTSRVIQDSAWPGVEDALKERMEALKDKPGKEAEYKLCQERYAGLAIDNVTIEPIKILPNGKRLVCITSRKTGFAKVDLEIQQKSAGEILSRVGKVVHLLESKSDLQNFISTIPSPMDIVYVKETDLWYGFIPGVNPDEELLTYTGKIFFDKGTVEANTATPVLEDGHYQLVLTDRSVIDTKGVIQLFDLTKLADEHAVRPTITPRSDYQFSETRDGNYAMQFDAKDQNGKEIKSVTVKEINWPENVFEGIPSASVNKEGDLFGIVGAFHLPVKYLNDKEKLTVTVVLEVINIDNEVSVSHPVGFNFGLVLSSTRIAPTGHKFRLNQPLPGGLVGSIAVWSFQDAYADPMTDCSIDVTDITVAGYQDLKYIETKDNEVRYQASRIYFDWDKGYVSLGKRRQLFEYHTGCVNDDFILDVPGPVIIDQSSSSLEHGVKATATASIMLKNSGTVIAAFSGPQPTIASGVDATPVAGIYDQDTNLINFKFSPVPPMGPDQSYSVPWEMSGTFTFDSEGKDFEGEISLTGSVTTVSGSWTENVPGLSQVGELAIITPLGLDGKTLFMRDHAIHDLSSGAVAFKWPEQSDPLPPYVYEGKPLPLCQVGTMTNGRGDIDPDTWMGKTREVTGTVVNLTNGIYTVSRALTTLAIRAPGTGWSADFYLKDNRLVAELVPPEDWESYPQINNLKFGSLGGTIGGELSGIGDFYPVNPADPIWGKNEYVWTGKDGTELLGKWELGDPKVIATVDGKVVISAHENILISQYQAGAKYANSIYFDNTNLNLLLGWDDIYRNQKPEWTGYETTIDDVFNNVPTQYAHGLTDASFNNIINMSQQSFGASPYTSHKVSFKYPSNAEPDDPRTSFILPKFSLPLVKINYEGEDQINGPGPFVTFSFEGLNELYGKEHNFNIKATHANIFGAVLKDGKVNVYYHPADDQVPSLSPFHPGFTATHTFEREMAGVKYGEIGWYAIGPEQIWFSPAFPGTSSDLVLTKIVKQGTDCIITLKGVLHGPNGDSVYPSAQVVSISKLKLDGVEYAGDGYVVGNYRFDTGEFDINVPNVPDGLTMKDVEISLQLDTGKWSDGHKTIPLMVSKKS